MITYQYGPYQPDDDHGYTSEKIMSLLSDMIMKYDISIEEALRALIAQGLPVNLFIKEGGMNDLVKNFTEKIQSQIEEILSTYDLQTLQGDLEKNKNSFAENLLEKFKGDPLLDSFKRILLENNGDALRRLRWELGSSKKGYADDLGRLIEKRDELSRIETGIRKYKFTGSQVPTAKEAIKIIQTLDDLTALVAALIESVENGDLYNFNLEKIAQYLGAESYQEFLETRDKIFEQLKELLEKQGMIQQNTEDGGLELTPASVRKIGKRTLTEIFSAMKSEDGSGSHRTMEYGDSENITSAVKSYEFGDSISHIDYPGSIINSVINGRVGKPGLNDLDVHLSIGSAKSSTVILLDMSGSMFRYNRFFNAKKVCLAMDALIREEFKDDKLTIVGFGSTTRIIPIAEMPLLQPYPVTIYDPNIRMVFDYAKLDRKQIEQVPMYFTNLQKGLQTARQILSGKQTKNKNIILITDGVPTAHFKGSKLHLNYPPVSSDFEEALSEVKHCRADKIVINTFLLTSDWDEFHLGGESFIKRFAKISQGRFFHPHPTDLNKMILYDFIQNKKRQIEY